MRVEVKSKVIPTSFLKIKGRETFVGAKEGRLVELVGDQNPSSEAPPRSKKGGSKGKIREGATARGAMEESRYFRLIEERRSEKMTQSNTSSPRGSEVPFESQRV